VRSPPAVELSRPREGYSEVIFAYCCWGGSLVTMRALILAAAFVSVSPALAETLYCSTSFQGYRVCDDGHGYRSFEWQWQGMTIGQDSDARTGRQADGGMVTSPRSRARRSSGRVSATSGYRRLWSTGCVSCAGTARATAT
jgi:hypothetical protein